MFQKLQKKLKEFFSEKGQGVVEYALVLGFVAVIAVILLSKSSLQQNVQKNIDNQNTVLSAMDARFSELKTTTTGEGDNQTTIDNLTGQTVNP